jgi:hypothetical protein
MDMLNRIEDYLERHHWELFQSVRTTLMPLDRFLLTHFGFHIGPVAWMLIILIAVFVIAFGIGWFCVAQKRKSGNHST